nr:hypothetical protein BSM_28900 [uncultured archaeon]CBH39898.1 hypothetical protein BSM_33770 [uncultured archaeon]
MLIIESALSGQAAVGGFAGATVAYAIRYGTELREVYFQMRQAWAALR